MYKLLIVDDEYIVRQGLRKIVPWNAMEMCIRDRAETAPALKSRSHPH